MFSNNPYRQTRQEFASDSQKQNRTKQKTEEITLTFNKALNTLLNWVVFILFAIFILYWYH